MLNLFTIFLFSEILNLGFSLAVNHNHQNYNKLRLEISHFASTESI